MHVCVARVHVLRLAGSTFEVLACQSTLLELAVQKNLEEVSHALMVVGVDVKQRYCGSSLPIVDISAMANLIM